jgi:hypothetical protein
VKQSRKPSEEFEVGKNATSILNAMKKTLTKLSKIIKNEKI